jgi:hypothetical protein
MDQKGYVISGLSFLLIIPAIYLVVVFADMAHTGSQSQGLLVQSDVIFSTSRDIDENLPLIAVNVLQKTANNVIVSGDPLQNSRMTVKDSLQEKIDNLTKNYHNEGINATCNILSINTAKDPFKVEINSTICIVKGNISHRENLSQNISIIDPNYPIPDPLPFIQCKNFGGVNNTGNRIIYGSSLVNYLKSKNMTNAEVYLNATSPLIIKKCPYDPYKTHGQSNNLINLKNCIDNGYFHKSSDGACFLCRLEGKALCSHYGMETFIIPSASTNNTLTSGPCSIDHVIFGEIGWLGRNYTGFGIIYYFNSTDFCKLYLDNGHRSKYGLANHTG